MSRLFAATLLCVAALQPALSQAASPPPAGLSLAEASRLALARSPGLARAAALIDAAEGRVSQSGVLPNPEFSYQLEDFAGDTGRSAGAATITYGLSQRLPLFGKRGAARELAGEARTVAVSDAELERLALLRQVRDAYVMAQAAAEREDMAGEAMALATQLRDAVSARVTAGKVSPLELARADVALAQARRLSEQSGRQSAAARRQLASFWGAVDIGGGLAGPVALPSAAGPEAPAEAHADDSPALRQAQARVREGEAAVRAAEAGRRPDITVSAGMKREADTRDESLLFGVSVPLPLFDRQQGALRAARAELVAAQAGLALARQQFGQAQDALLLQRDTAWREAAQLRDEVLPVAGRVLAGVREGYRAGKFSLLELLDAQRSLMSDREAYLAARQSFHQSDAALDELLGRAAVAGDAP